MMTMALTYSRNFHYTYNDLIIFAKRGYAILDNQNIHIPIKPAADNILITPTEKKNETKLTYFYTF